MFTLPLSTSNSMIPWKSFHFSIRRESLPTLHLPVMAPLWTSQPAPLKPTATAPPGYHQPCKVLILFASFPRHCCPCFRGTSWKCIPQLSGLCQNTASVTHFSPPSTPAKYSVLLSRDHQWLCLLQSLDFNWLPPPLNRECDGWMASPTQWTWIWANSGRWWGTGKPGMLQSMGSQRGAHNLVTEKGQQTLKQHVLSSPLTYSSLPTSLPAPHRQGSPSMRSVWTPPTQSSLSFSAH